MQAVQLSVTTEDAPPKGSTKLKKQPTGHRFKSSPDLSKPASLHPGYHHLSKKQQTIGSCPTHLSGKRPTTSPHGQGLTHLSEKRPTTSPHGQRLTHLSEKRPTTSPHGQGLTHLSKKQPTSGPSSGFCTVFRYFTLRFRSSSSM